MPGDCRVTSNILWVMVACLLSGIGAASIMAVWTELLLLRACESRHLPYPSQACDQSEAAQSEATYRQTYMGLAQSIPAALTVGMVSSIADSRGRRLAMILSFVSTLIFCSAVFLVPDRVFGLDGYWLIIVVTAVCSFTGGQTATFSSAMSVIADVSVDWTAVQRTNLFMLLEAALWGGGIIGPVLGGAVAKAGSARWGAQTGLRNTFLFAVILIVLGIALLLCCYKETLRPVDRQPFSWARANPVSAMFPLFSHPVMRRFAFMFATAGVGQNGFFFVTNLYLVRVADFTLMELSWFATIGTATTVAGLLLALPLLQRCLSTKALINFSVLDSAVQLLLLGVLALPVWWKISGQDGGSGDGSDGSSTTLGNSGNYLRTLGPYIANGMGFGQAICMPCIRSTVAVLCATGEVRATTRTEGIASLCS